MNSQSDIKLKGAGIHKSKLTLQFSDAKHPELHHSKKRPSSRLQKWFTHIDSQINKVSLRPESPDALADPHLEELTITATLGNTEFILTKVYIASASFCTWGYTPYLDHLMMTTETRILGDFNAHHLSWYSSSTYWRGTMLESMVSGCTLGILDRDSSVFQETATPSSHDVSLASASLITSINWQKRMNLGSDHLPIHISFEVTISPIQHIIDTLER